MGAGTKTLVYAPAVKAVIISDGVQYDISRDIVSGSVQRRVNSTSQAVLTLSNEGLKYSNRFKRMDRISISLRRVGWTKVFTGYLDSVPAYQLYPGPVQIAATCTLKRLMYTYWDPSLPDSLDLFDQQAADDQQADAQGLPDSQDDTPKKDNKAAENGDTSDDLGDTSGKGLSPARTADAGLGTMIANLLKEVGGWTDDEIHIQEVPSDFIQELVDSASESEWDSDAKTEAFRDLFGYNETISGVGAGASGGALGEAVFTTIGPPANGIKYNDRELVWIVENAGWSGEDVVTGVAIIKAESDGDPSATNFTNSDGSIDRGLWQINSIHDNTIMPGANRYDPAVSTEIARILYKNRGNWDDWHTLVIHHTAQQHFAAARVAQQQGGVAPPGSKLKDGSTSKGGGSSKSGTSTKSSTAPTSSDPKAKDGDKKDNAKKKDYNIAPSPSPAPIEGETGSSYISKLGGYAPNTDGMRVFESIAAVALYKFPMMTLTSGARFTDNGYHSKYQAADISNAGNEGSPEMKQLAQWWYDNFFGKGLLELIHSPFNNNVGDDTNVGDGMTQYYNPGTMSEHRNHVHIAMSGVVSVDGTSDGIPGVGGMAGGISFENKLGKALFDYRFDPTSFENLSGIAELFTGERAPANDQPLITAVSDVCDASLRNFMSGPDGSFIAFYPDYFGFVDSSAVLKLEDIELKDLTINASDYALATHVYVAGGSSLSGFEREAGEYGFLDTAGVATIENEWLFQKLTERSIVKSDLNAQDFVKRFGIRPLPKRSANYVSPEMEFLGACHLFMSKWAEQFSTEVSMTFMPELFPGMRVELVGHGITLYVESVTHNFNFNQSGGFTTSAVLTTPMSTVKNSALVEGAK